MPTIHRIGNILIQVYANDHNPPHFHVATPERRAMIRIDSLALLAGSLAARDYRRVCEWAAQNRRLLIDEWSRLNG